MSTKMVSKRYLFLPLLILEILFLFWAIHMERVNYNTSMLSTGSAFFQSIAIKCMISGIVAFFYWKIVVSILVFYKKEEIFCFLVSLSYLLLLVISAIIFYKCFNYIGSYGHGDMERIIGRALEYKFLSYQGWYSTIFYGVVLQLLPIDYVHYGLVGFQMIIISYIVGYELMYIRAEYGNRRMFLAGCVFSLPPVLYFAQFTLRQTWFAFSFILLITEIDKYLKRKINQPYLLSFLTALLAIFRPEGKWLILFMVIFIAREEKRREEKRREEKRREEPAYPLQSVLCARLHYFQYPKRI